MTVSGFTIISADRQPVHNLGSQTHNRRSVARKTNAMAVVRALQDLELIAQGKDFSLQGAPVPKQASAEKSREMKRVNMALAAYMPQLHKFNCFNESGSRFRRNRKRGKISATFAISRAWR